MINFNGILYTDLSTLPKDSYSFFSSPFHLEEYIRYENGTLLFWELHYFRIMASMRRLRYAIPNTFTMEYLKAEVEKTILQKHHGDLAVLIRFKVIADYVPTEASYKGLCFIIEGTNVPLFAAVAKDNSFALDLYKDAFVFSGLLSNLTLINAPLRKMVAVYAQENGLDDCFLLNDQKHLVETTLGTPYLIKNGVWSTPDLMSGCQNSVFRNAFNTWLKNKRLDTLTLEERSITAFELQQAEEILIISLVRGGISVTNYRKTVYKNHQGQEVFGAFVTAFNTLV